MTVITTVYSESESYTVKAMQCSSNGSHVKTKALMIPPPIKVGFSTIMDQMQDGDHDSIVSIHLSKVVKHFICMIFNVIFITYKEK